MLAISAGLFAGVEREAAFVLVQTFLDLVQVILMHRHRNHGLLLSELGDHLLGGCQAWASRRETNCQAAAFPAVEQPESDGISMETSRSAGSQEAAGCERVYAIWDESVIEKAESLKAEGLCAVRSSKAARLKRIKPGYFNPPGGRPIFVPGMNWLQVLVVGSARVPCLAHLRWCRLP